MKTKTNLVLLSRHEYHTAGALAPVVEHVRRIADDVVPHIVEDRRLTRWRRLSLAMRPTLVFSAAQVRKWRALRGRVYQGRRFMTKADEYARLEAAGVPVPHWTLLREGHDADVSGFDEYVITKPIRGGRGAHVRIRRRGRVRWSPMKDPPYPENTDLIAQRFVYTGPWPVCYRVSTLFGRAISSWRVVADAGGRPLTGPDRFGDGGGYVILSSGKGCRFTCNHEPDVIEFGERAAAALPEVPLLGIDILREQPSGKLFVIETNPSGWTWPFGSFVLRSVERDNGLDFAAEFDGPRLVAKILVERARAEAR